MFEKMDARHDGGARQAGGAGGSTTYEALLRADAAWRAIRLARPGDAGPPPRFVTEAPSRRLLAADGTDGALDFDVVVCGGTLGIFVAAALAQRGHRVACVERGPLRGRAQEWNISRKELGELREVRAVQCAALRCAVVSACRSVSAPVPSGRSSLLTPHTPLPKSQHIPPHRWAS